MGIGCRVSACLRHVNRRECGVAFVDQTPCKIAVAAIAGAVISRVEQEERLGIRRRPPRNWRLAPRQIFSIEVKPVRYIPMNHGHCPLKPLRRDWMDTCRRQERMSPRQGKSRVVNSDW